MKMTRLRKLMGEENWALYQTLRNRLKTEKCLEKAGDKVVNWRKRAKLKLIEYKGGKCEICGYDKDVPNAYDFHHKDRKEKEFGIGSGDAKSFDRMKKESDKCMLLCRNCHAEVHAKEYRLSEKVTLERKTLKIESLQKEINTLLDRFIPQVKIVKRYNINCSVCNKIITNNSTKKCRRCYCKNININKKRPNSNMPPKEILEQEIKEMSWTAIGKKYNVSDNAVKKWARNYNIPFITRPYKSNEQVVTTH